MKRHSQANSRRGAVMIIVVALLGVLALMVVTLSYGTRVEYMAARNWANSVQSRMAAVSELPTFQPIDHTGGITIMSADNTVTSADGSRRLGPVALNLKPTSAFASKANLNAPLATVIVSDTSSRFNINAVIPAAAAQQNATLAKSGKTAVQTPTGFIGEAELARLISAVMESNAITGIDAHTLAHNIAIHRYGKDGKPGEAGIDDNFNASAATRALGVQAMGIIADRLDNDRDGKIDNKEESLDRDGIDNDFDGIVDEPGEGIDEPAECLSDPRLQPNGDDTPYCSLAELMAVKGMTQKLYAALEPHLTVLSVSYAAFELPDQTGVKNPAGWPQLDPNTAPPELIFGTLRQRFPQVSNDVIGQFVANLVDRRDKDSVPCKLELDGGVYRGQELTPCINEICSSNLGVPISVKTSKHGQFVEIVNPYKTALDIDGWVLVGAGPEIALSGKIPPGGYYVVTDDYNDQNDKNRGKIPDSFFANFGVVSSGSDQIIIENIELDLMAGNGHLELKDAKGNLIDEFDFDTRVRTGMSLSFQRNDPRLNEAVTAPPTPLRANSGATETGALSAEGKLALETFEQTANQLFRSPLDVMLVSTAHRTAGDDNKTKTYPWQLPALTADNTQHLDIRLVDCFMPGVDVPLTSKPKTELSASSKDDKRTNEIIRSIEAPNVAVMSGRVNLNTASIGVLAALPGMSGTILAGIRDARETTGTIERSSQSISTKDKDYWTELQPHRTARWANLSDFISDDNIWGQATLYERLNQAYPFAMLIGTHTMSMTSVASTRVAKPAVGDTRRQSVTRAERLLAGDRGVVETVNFRFVGSSAEAAGDPDQRSAIALSQAQNRLIFHPSALAKSMGRKHAKNK